MRKVQKNGYVRDSLCAERTQNIRDDIFEIKEILKDMNVKLGNHIVHYDARLEELTNANSAIKLEMTKRGMFTPKQMTAILTITAIIMGAVVTGVLKLKDLGII